MKNQKSSIAVKGLACLLGTILVHMILFCLLFSYEVKIEEQVRLERARSELVDEINTTITSVANVWGNIATTLFRPDKRFETDPVEYKRDMNKLYERLAASSKNDSELRKVVEDLRQLYLQQSDILEQVSNQPDGAGIVGLMKIQPILRKSTKNLAKIKKRMAIEADRIEEVRQETVASRAQMKNVLTAGIVIDFIFTPIILLWFFKNITDRLKVLIENARLVPQGKSLEKHVRGTDEIAYLDEVLHQASDELQNASAYRKSLMEMVSHDLRSPLMSSNLSLDLMLTENKDGPEKLKRRILTLKSSISRLVRLVEDLLSIEKLESGQVELALEVVQFMEIVDQSIESIEAQAVTKNVEIRNEVQSVTVVADRNRMLQLVGNFLSNAIKFSPKGGKIIVSSRLQNSELFIFVTDEGPGIKAEEQASLFEKFYQAEEGKAQKGFGLGLAICKMIVTQHGGTIGVTSEPGKGSSFWFGLPLDEEADEQAHSNRANFT